MNDVMFKDYDIYDWRIARMFMLDFIDDQKYGPRDSFSPEYFKMQLPLAARYDYACD